MNLLCRIAGHTWVTVTEAPAGRWNTTKAMHTLEWSGGDDDDVQFFEECSRCKERRESTTKSRSIG